MRKGHFLAIVLLSCFAILSGCIKNQPYVTTIDPSLTASIGTYNFTAGTVYPSTLDSQMHDSVSGLVITATTNDQTAPYDKIILFVAKYKGNTGTYSIVQSQAGARYTHSGITSVASGGVVAITKVNADNIVGYFSFNTADGIAVKNGNFTVGLP